MIDLKKEGDEYILSSSSTFQNVVTRFKPGVEFDEETPDGRKVKATITIEGNTLKEVKKLLPSVEDGHVTTIDRTFTDDEVKIVSTLFLIPIFLFFNGFQVMTIGEIVSTRVYKLQA